MQKTLKIKYNSPNIDIIRDCLRQYSSTLKYTYNRIFDNMGGLSTKQLTFFQKNLNNIPLIDSHFKNSAVYEAKSIYTRNKDKKVIFKKENFINRCKNKISKDQFKENKYLPLCSIGEANQKGNRKFQIISESLILFKINRDLKVKINLCNLKSNLKKEILQLLFAQNNKQLPITYRLDLKYIYISYEETQLKSFENILKLQNRVFAIDVNPNYIGWSVVDWKNSDEYKLISSGVISIKKINDKDNSLKGKGLNSQSKERKYITDKRNNEIIQTSIYLVSLAKHYSCSLFIVEDLNIKSQDNNRGKKYNRLINNLWNRNLLYNQINKRCDLLKIEFLKILPNYSSFVGNMAYRKENKPDMILSSIEIGRRGYEFYHQYIAKDKPKSKNIIFNESELNKTLIVQSMEELGLKEEFTNIKDLYFKITKTLKLGYRVLFNSEKLKSFSLKSIKSKIILY